MAKKSKLLSNLRIEKLDSQTDYLEIISKGSIIKDFLIGSQNSFDEIKMFALYGEWGSGKSSLMKYLQSELKESFNTFFFEAWEFEKDENLAFSLLEFIRMESKSVSEQFYDDFIKYGSRILRGLGKSIKMNIPLFQNGPALEVNPSAFVEEFTKEQELTFYEALKKFKLEFIKLEDSITLENQPKFNIIFIDDLDRCEPEQVLNLMSAIKLFFTYGNKTIFFCGIDKKAVEEAVRTKYGKVIKSNEYLEKIFDITFSMPKHENIFKLITNYFNDCDYKIGNKVIPINSLIHEFLNALDFTNPRRIKKLLNKFQLLRDFSKMSWNTSIVFPEIDLYDNIPRSALETITVLYLIILHEFFSDDFNGFLDFDRKRDIYNRNTIDINHFNNIDQAITSNLAEKSFLEIYDGMSNHKNEFSEPNFYICISPLKVTNITINHLVKGKGNNIQVSSKHIDFLFFKYINKISPIDWLEYSQNSSSFKSIKKVVSQLL